MEASKKSSPAAERLAALVARYPEKDFIWIMPRLDLAGDLPEHLDFMVSTRKFHSGDVYDQSGGVALRKSALMALAADAGLKWVSHLSGRQDNGSNPDIVDWQATGMIADLGGLTPITRNKHIDLERMRMRDTANGKKPDEVKKNDMQRQQFKYEMAESGAVTRVVRDALGVPNVFDVEDIKNKQFAILRVILSPKARTPEERKLILGRMMDNYMPAFPTTQAPAGPVLIEAAPDRPQIEGPREPKPANEDYELLEITGAEVIEDREKQPESVPMQPPEAPASPPPPMGKPIGKPSGDKITFMQAVQDIKRRFVEFLGEGGTEEYYGVLRKAGHEHCNEVVDAAEQKTIYKELLKRIELLEQNLPPKATPEAKAEGSDDFLDYMLKSRRAGFERMEMEKLSEHIDALMSSCPSKQYPKDWQAIIESGDKARMIDLAVELVKISVLEAKRLREAHNAKGGARA